jgi:hypothetical protein
MQPLNVSHLYDNSADSDFTIILPDETLISAHRLILRIGSAYFQDLAIRHLDGPVGNHKVRLTNPPRCARLAIKFIYGISINSEITTAHDWESMIKVAVALGIHDLVAELCRVPPSVITPLKMISLADNTVVLDTAIQMIMKQETTFEPKDTKVLDATSYEHMRNRWIEKQWPTFMLLSIDCCYESYRNKSQHLSEKLKNIQFDKFTVEQLTAAAAFPVICDSPARHMIECMLRIATRA